MSTIPKERLVELLTRYDFSAPQDFADAFVAIGELLALRAANEWRPIETAPRDGTIIIGWSAGWESSTAIQWIGETSLQGDWDWNGTIQCPPNYDPTHWHPLPPAPTTQPEKEST